MSTNKYKQEIIVLRKRGWIHFKTLVVIFFLNFFMVITTPLPPHKPQATQDGSHIK